MTVEVIHARPSENGKYLEIVKEITPEGGGEPQMFLHVVPYDAIVNHAAHYGVDDPDEAIDIILYGPHVNPEHDAADSMMESVRKCKERVAPQEGLERSSGAERLQAKGISPDYYPTGESVHDILKRIGQVTTAKIREQRTNKYTRKGKDGQDVQTRNPAPVREPDPQTTGRDQPRRAHVRLGTPGGRRSGSSGGTDGSIQQ